MNWLVIMWIGIAIASFLAVWVYGLLSFRLQKECKHSWIYIRKCVNCSKKEVSEVAKDE